MGGWVDLYMRRFIALLLFIGLAWGQDVLLTIDKKEFKGKLLEQSDKNTTFLPDGQKTPQKIPNRLIKEIRLESNKIIDFGNDFLISELEKKDIFSENLELNQYPQFDTTKSEPAIDYATFKYLSLSFGILDDHTGFSLISSTFNIPINRMTEAYIGFGGLVTPFGAAFTTAGGLKLYYIRSKISIYSILAIQKMTHSDNIFSSGSIGLSLRSDEHIQIKLGVLVFHSLTKHSEGIGGKGRKAFPFGGVTLSF